MAPDSGFADPDDEESPLRPVWDDTPDETDAHRGLPRQHSGRTRQAGMDDLPRLLDPLCATTDALARLDARAAAAADPVRDGLLARLAYWEAAGSLAHSHAWAHPLDLALRERGLTASTALAAAGSPHRALPQTVAAGGDPPAWTDPLLDELAQGDAALTEALALARALRRLAGKASGTAGAGVTALAMMLHGLGPGAPDPADFATWWDGVVLQPVPPRAPLRHARRAGDGTAPAAAARGGADRPGLDGGGSRPHPDPGAGAAARRRAGGARRYRPGRVPAGLGRLSRARLRRP